MCINTCNYHRNQNKIFSTLKYSLLLLPIQPPNLTPAALNISINLD